MQRILPTNLRGPLIVTAAMGREDQSWADKLRETYYPADRNMVPAHITLLHHLPPSLIGELRGLLAAMTLAPPPAGEVDRAFSSGGFVATGVRSPGLIDLWSELAERFHRHLIPQDRSPPRLHITIQNKVSGSTAQETLASLRENLRPRTIKIAALDVWAYEGGPWSPVCRYPFRG